MLVQSKSHVGSNLTKADNINVRDIKHDGWLSLSVSTILVSSKQEPKAKGVRQYELSLFKVILVYGDPHIQ